MFTNFECQYCQLSFAAEYTHGRKPSVCPECRAKMRRDSQRERRAAERGVVPPEVASDGSLIKPCRRCGARFKPEAANGVNCDACNAELKREKWRREGEDRRDYFKAYMRERRAADPDRVKYPPGSIVAVTCSDCGEEFSYVREHLGGKLRTVCDACKVRAGRSSAKSERYRKSAHGAANRQAYRQRPDVKAKSAEYQKSAEAAAAKLKYKQSEHGKIKIAEYEQTAGRKANRERYLNSEKGLRKTIGIRARRRQPPDRAAPESPPVE